MSDTLILRLNFSGSAFAFGSAFPFGSVLAESGLFLAGGWATDPAAINKRAATRAANEAGRMNMPRGGNNVQTTIRPGPRPAVNCRPRTPRGRYVPNSRRASSTPGAGLPY